MICLDCRQAGNDARMVLNAAPGQVGMGALQSALRGHGKCRGGTWCDCKHQLTADAYRTAEPA